MKLGTPCINTFSSEAMLGKMEVSFKQWYHEVQSVKDHYYGISGLGRVVCNLLKGAAADIAMYMGPTTCMAYILQN